MSEIKPDALHQLLGLLLTGNYEPLSVWADFYSKWDREQRDAFCSMLMSVVMSGKRGEIDMFGEEYKRASRCLDYLEQKECEQPEQPPQSPTNALKTAFGSVGLKLTEEQEKVLQKAIETGLMSQSETGYKWHKSNALLAYLCGRLFCSDTFQRDVAGELVIKRVGMLPETALSTLFSVKHLGNSRGQLTHPPKGSEIVDALF